MVFYRKYRPQKIDDLDNAHVREVLTSVLSAKELPHAFLFTGPKGLGKTSTARIVAKAIDCENKKKGSVEPCNECEQCLSITNGTNLDVMEIDAASNRGIDEIRDLREKIKLSPFKAQKKIYIIDEVHMLTTEAFNALLKTLEEPPAHAVFILCTTELHKVPSTIASRCFHIGFTLATDEELERAFKRIAKSEKLDIDTDVFAYIAKLSGGSFRDGTKILEELVGLASGKKITKEILETKFQISNIQVQIANMFDALEKKDTKKSLEVVQKLIKEGTEIKYFIEELINSLHNDLLQQLEVHVRGSSLSSESRSARPASNSSPSFSIEEIKILIELLSKAHGETKYAVLSQLPLEMAIIEWSALGGKEKRIENNMDEKKSLTVDDLKREQKNEQIRQVIASHRGGEPTTVKVAAGEENLDEEKTTHRQTSIEKRTGSHQDFFDEFIQEVKLKNNSLAGVLRGCTIASFNDNVLVLQTAYKFHKERLEEQKAHIILEEVAKAITGKKVEITVELKGR